MAVTHYKIPIEEMREYLEVDPTSKTGLRWKKKIGRNIEIGSEAGCLRKDGYYQLGFKRKIYLAHRIIFALANQLDPGEYLVDHADVDKNNNSQTNLRILNDSKSLENRRGYGRSSYKGVSWSKRNKKWQVLINLNKKQKHLGYFNDEHEAGRVAKEAYTKRDGIYMT